MKNLIRLTTTIALVISFVNIYGQCPCVSCDDNTVGAGKFANAMGRYNFATGYYTSAIGFTNNASGNGSFSIGTFNNSIGEYSATLGSYLKATGNNSIVIGSGLQNKPLLNNIANSVMIGGLSDVPTYL